MVSIDRYSGLEAGVAIKAPVKVASTGNLTLESSQTIDGSLVSTGDRVLVKDQTTATENGIYTVASSSWTRTLDFDGSRDIVTGSIVHVLYGTVAGNSFWRLTSSSTSLVPGTNSLAFSQANTALAGFSAFMSSLVTLSSDAVVSALGSQTDLTQIATSTGAIIYRDSTAMRSIVLNSSTSFLMGGSSRPQYRTLTSALDDIVSTAAGTIIYRGSTGWQQLVTSNSTGELLTVSSTAGGIGWLAAAAGGGITAASTAQAEAATASTVGLTPASAQHHPGVAKVWAQIGAAATAITSHNITSITDVGEGDWRLNFTTPFSSTNYAVNTSLVSSSTDWGTAINIVGAFNAKATAVDIMEWNSTGTLNENANVKSVTVVIFGDQ